MILRKRFSDFSLTAVIPVVFAPIMFAAALTALPTPAGADALADFYKGKRMTLIVGSTPGGGYDAYARLFARHMGRHIPGNPSFLVKNMPGAGSLKATNFVYNIAPQDGTVIGGIQRGNAFEPILGNTIGPKFDPMKFQWLGSLNNEAGIIKTRKVHPVKTIADAKKQKAIMGSSGADTEIFPSLLNNTIGTKFEVISGYPSTTTVELAIERRELDGLAHSFSSMVQRAPDWRKKFNILAQLSLRKHPDPPNVPLVFELINKDPVVKGLTVDEVNTMWRLMLTQKVMGRPYTLGPGVPKDRVAGLRLAFKNTVKDPVFIADANKQKREIVPVDGQAIQGMITKVASAPKSLIAKLKGFIRYKGPVKTVKIKMVKHMGKVVQTKRSGRRIYITHQGQKVMAKVSGSRSKVTIGGKKADRGKVKTGMTCTFTYPAAGREATNIDCK
jgi:tripartite-type tricarboxylate transporter receptor subunit TctC